jgi:hypothetical protein
LENGYESGIVFQVLTAASVKMAVFCVVAPKFTDVLEVLVVFEYSSL